MNEMYCSEQINIPSEMGTVIKLLTKSAIRDKPADVYKWAANYFASQCNRPAAFDAESGKLTQAGRDSVPHSQPYTTSGMRTKPVMGGGGSPQQQQQQYSQKKNNLNEDHKHLHHHQQEQEADTTGENEQEEENRIVDTLFDKYDPERTNTVYIDELPKLIMDLKQELGLDFTDEQMAEFVNSMQTDKNGNVDLDEFRVSFFQG